jgi:hypothetical protein
VFERENTDGAVWTPTGEDHHEFLWHFVVEAVFGGDIGAGANNVDADGFQRLATAMGADRRAPMALAGAGSPLMGPGRRARLDRRERLARRGSKRVVLLLDLHWGAIE